MRDEPPPRKPGGEGEPATRPVAHLDRNLWRRFADAQTPEEFSQAWLGLQARMIGGVSATETGLLRDSR